MKAINYSHYMAKALREMVASVIRFVELNGLPEQNHFEITFFTGHSGVELPSYLREQFPETMQIIIQHWYRNLETGDGGFWVTLNFNNKPETIYIPYNAMLKFTDPSAGIELNFPPPFEIIEKNESDPKNDDAERSETIEEDTIAQIVNIDNFRKN